ncbi:hypothetical protein GFS60_07677 (plasmid) [Rhodococcus sp. WAY2]|nr:hypothetical protein GFS60_07677 [Rhodococcus sp. WAY2]
MPMLRLAQAAGLGVLAQHRLSVPTDKGANAGAKVTALVAGMLAGADSIDDMNLLRHGGMAKLFDRVYAPSTLGSFLREFRFGHARQLDAVASRLLVNRGSRAPLLNHHDGERVLVDLDDTIIDVHGYQKQGAGFGYSGVRGLNALLAVASTSSSAPVILAQRLRKGRTGSPKGAARIVGDPRGDAASHEPRERVTAGAGAGGFRALRACHHRHRDQGGRGCVGHHPAGPRGEDRDRGHRRRRVDDDRVHRRDPRREHRAVDLQSRGRRGAVHRIRSWNNSERVDGRLIVRRIPDLNPKQSEQPTLFDTFRHHAFFTTSNVNEFDTVAADKTHRHHAIIEQVHSDLKNGPLAHLPSGVFTANSAWLVLAVIAFNLTRAAGVLADHGGRLARATSATIRRALIHVPARLARSARRIRLHLPASDTLGERVREAVRDHPRATTGSNPLITAAPRPTEDPVDNRDATPGTHPCPDPPAQPDHANAATPKFIGESRLSTPRRPGCAHIADRDARPALTLRGICLMRCYATVGIQGRGSTARLSGALQLSVIPTIR